MPSDFDRACDSALGVLADYVGHLQYMVEAIVDAKTSPTNLAAFRRALTEHSIGAAERRGLDTVLRRVLEEWPKGEAFMTSLGQVTRVEGECDHRSDARFCPVCKPEMFKLVDVTSFVPGLGFAGKE